MCYEYVCPVQEWTSQFLFPFLKITFRVGRHFPEQPQRSPAGLQLTASGEGTEFLLAHQRPMTHASQVCAGTGRLRSPLLRVLTTQAGTSTWVPGEYTCLTSSLHGLPVACHTSRFPGSLPSVAFRKWRQYTSSSR